jgi:hypothetical protein
MTALTAIQKPKPPHAGAAAVAKAVSDVLAKTLIS